MIRSVLIALLVVAVLGTGYWGYLEHQEKNAVLIQAENNYQRAFHELSYDLDHLHDELGSALAMNSRERLSPSLTDVWRITSEAQSDLGQLPMSLMPFSKTEEFLHKIGDFSYRNAVRDLDQEPLSEEEYEQLKTLYSQSGEIQDEMRKVQGMVINDNLKWMDVELAMAAQDNPGDNAIINGFEIIDEKAGHFSETDFGPDSGHITKTDEEIAERVEGLEEIDEQEAVDIAGEFLDRDKDFEVEVDTTGDGLAYKAYSLTIEDPDDGHDIYMDITKKGGKPLWLLEDRQIETADISLYDASEKAGKFLEKNGFESMALVDSKQYENTGVFNFAHMQNDVRVYSDAVVVEVALDNGDIIGYEGFSYIANHEKEKPVNQSLTREEARDRLNPALEVMEHHLAVIENELEEEVLCHEFFGTIDDDTYRIFINAENGREERVEKMDRAEPVYDFD
ncbi:germination protein YpeB [Alteribacter natronophilus]|uniref:germination protein YpeB n=1 Tax=Alteribacter natronophilus TaxID=2583810 RepID=UPI00110D2E16|nr:germination protein YpeB [Alteribacter natronophilus]TMW73619.1 germination protein YpeB [Alteribacter natronophilus]